MSCPRVSPIAQSPPVVNEAEREAIRDKAKQAALGSSQIRNEITRFESVHPCIYQVYDVVEYLIENKDLFCTNPKKENEYYLTLTRLREQMLNIEDAFVNSHEWTLGRSVIEVHLGVIGSASSAKSALIHRFLTDAYSAEETPEGGRYKKEIVVDGQSYLLLIRDEGTRPLSGELASWSDAIIYAFSVDDPISFLSVEDYYRELNGFCNISELPAALVGTKDTVSAENPRVVMENEGREKLTKLGKRCAYFETSAKHGTNVDRMFRDTAARALRQRWKTIVRNANKNMSPGSNVQSPPNEPTLSSARFPHNSTLCSSPKGSAGQVIVIDTPKDVASQSMISAPTDDHVFAIPLLRNEVKRSRSKQSSKSGFSSNGSATQSATIMLSTPSGPTLQPAARFGGSVNDASQIAGTSHIAMHTPGTTPTTQRKNRRISNIFRRDTEDKSRLPPDLGVGRAIPIRQGNLYKKTNKQMLNREWKKKFVVLYPDGRMMYYPSFKDYTENRPTGKTAFLGLCTVRVAGRRQTKVPSTIRTSDIFITPESSAERRCETYIDGTSGGSDDAGHGNIILSPAPSQTSKKKVRRRKNSLDDENNVFFEIVTSDQKHWEFCAETVEERDEWVKEIEKQIAKALEGGAEFFGPPGSMMSLTSDCSSAPIRPPSVATNRESLARNNFAAPIMAMPGNNRCADCGHLADVNWVSLNLGIVMCIECAGVHRELGAHISRIRSLTLDNSSGEQLAVVRALGNDKANQIWEKNMPRDAKPKPTDTREAKEAFIRDKYALKRYLPAIRVDETLGTQIVQAVLKKDSLQLLLLLTKSDVVDVNGPVGPCDSRTALHLACSNGSLEAVQLLIWYGADIFALDSMGRSSLWYAQQGGNADCTNILYANGLPSDYGLPPQESMIMGSHVSRDPISSPFASISDPHVSLRGISEQSASPSSNAFDSLPASVI